jgi:hypothetical protein
MQLRCQFRAAFRFYRPSSSIKIEIAVDRESSLSSEPPSHKAKEGGEEGKRTNGLSLVGRSKLNHSLLIFLKVLACSEDTNDKSLPTNALDSLLP